MTLLYFFHDLNHSDVQRRVEMLRQGGAAVTVIGFHRMATVPVVEGATLVGLGITEDGNFPQRILAVLRTLLTLHRWRDAFADGDAVVARNLEMLVLAAMVRWRFLPGLPLTYECVDIHRLMTRTGMVGRLLRLLEGSLLRRTQAIVTSSPRFISAYFQRYYARLPRTLLVENKIFRAAATARPPGPALPPGPPWRIGWFGVLRCQRSLDLLTEVARRAPHLLSVLIAGRPSIPVFPAGEAVFAGRPGIDYVGPYDGEAAVTRLFASVDFAWAMDFYEAGANSDWLLPNRLYRSVYHGSVPIALAGVETGRWLADRAAGLLLDAATPEALIASLEAMTAERLAGLQSALARVPDTALVTTPAECEAFVRALIAPDRAAPDATMRPVAIAP